MLIVKQSLPDLAFCIPIDQVSAIQDIIQISLAFLRTYFWMGRLYNNWDVSVIFVWISSPINSCILFLILAVQFCITLQSLKKVKRKKRKKSSKNHHDIQTRVVLLGEPALDGVSSVIYYKHTFLTWAIWHFKRRIQKRSNKRVLLQNRSSHWIEQQVYIMNEKEKNQMNCPTKSIEMNKSSLNYLLCYSFLFLYPLFL